MKSIAKVIFFICFAEAAWSQQPPKAPDCNSYVIQKTISGLSETPGGLSGKQRFCIYAGKLITGQALFGSAFFSGVAQFRDDPVEWGQGAKGYLRRFGTRYAQGVAKSTGEFVAGWVFKEDPRYEVSEDTGFWKRTGHALASVFVVRNVNGRRQPAFSKFAGAASSGLVGLTWYPDRLNTATDVLSRTGSGFGGYLASSIFQEFQADIFRGLAKIFGSDRNVSSSSQSSRGAK